MKKWFRKPASKPTIDNPILDVVFIEAMARFDKVNPQPDIDKHFLKAFATSLAFHTDNIVRILILDPEVPDWESIGKEADYSKLRSVGSYFGLRLSDLVIDDLEFEKTEPDETERRMQKDMHSIANALYGQDRAGLEAFHEYLGSHTSLTEGDANSMHITLSEVVLIDRLVGLVSSQFESAQSHKNAVYKSFKVFGALAGNRGAFYETVDGFLTK